MQRTDTRELRDCHRAGPVASSLQEPAGKSGADEQCAVVMGSAATTQMIAKIDAEVEARTEDIAEAQADSGSLSGPFCAEAAVQKHDCASRLESDFYVPRPISASSALMARERGLL